ASEQERQAARGELHDERARGFFLRPIDKAVVGDREAQVWKGRAAKFHGLTRKGSKSLSRPRLLLQKVVQRYEGAALDHGVFPTVAGGSAGLLYPGKQPAGGAVHRLSQMPDLLEWLRRCARLFADRTGKSHARPIQLALGDELQERSVQGHDVGLLHARMLGDVAF